MSVQKTPCTWKNIYIWNSTICSCENGNYLASIMDDSATACEIIESYNKETKTILTISNNKSNANFYNLHAFLWITIASYELPKK